MSFKDLTEEQKIEMCEEMFRPLESINELKDWILGFFDLDMPNGHIDPDSNSSPIEAMWEIYSCVKENRGEDNPGYIMLSAREGYKTLSASILEVLLIVHFKVTIAHLAAIQAQSAKAIQYINFFFNKIEPLLEHSGWEKTSENKSKVSYRTKEGEDVYVRVIVATMAGANCITGDMKIHTDMGILTAKEIFQLFQNGNELKFLSFNHNHDSIEYCPISMAWKENKEEISIELEDGTIIKCSKEHKFYVEGKGYIEAQYLTTEDFLNKNG